MNLNKVFILGNVTRDPEARALPSGQQVTNFGLATNRFYTDSAGQKKQEAEFHNVVAFGKLADISSRYLNKGSLVLIEGRIRTRNWVNSTGVKQYRTEIVADNMQLGPRSAGSMSGGGQTKPFSAPEPEPAKQEEIPIIEENYTPPSTEAASDLPAQTGDIKQVSFEGDASDEIDVRDIPF